MFNETDVIDLFYPEYNRAKHHLLGHYLSVQEEGYELAFVAGLPNRADKISRADINQALEWILLLKINDVRRIKFTWIDAGSVLFFIHRDDLEKGDFSMLRGFAIWCSFLIGAVNILERSMPPLFNAP
jgi:uncharacterized protein YwqG